jgi:hypothetical protein
MNIKHEIKTAEAYGKGIFALENIKAGTCIWSYNLHINVFEFDETACNNHLSSLPTLAARQEFLNYTFGKGDKLCLITDNGVYMNHADASACNCKTDLKTGDCFAIGDINIGEQLFENYATFSHPPFLYELLKKYQCEPSYYDIHQLS